MHSGKIRSPQTLGTPAYYKNVPSEKEVLHVNNNTSMGIITLGWECLMILTAIMTTLQHPYQ